MTEHRGAAEERTKQADLADRKARIAEQEAQRERADAQLHEERAAMHEEGLVDHELVGQNERDRFAGTSAVSTDREALEEEREGRAAGESRGDVADGGKETPAADTDR